MCTKQISTHILKTFWFCPFHLVPFLILLIALCSGWLLIAEVRSRFDPNNEGADPEKFCRAVQGLGFTSTSKVLLLICYEARSFACLCDLLSYICVQDFSNKMFVLFFFKKKVCGCRFMIMWSNNVIIYFNKDTVFIHRLLLDMTPLSPQTTKDWSSVVLAGDLGSVCEYLEEQQKKRGNRKKKKELGKKINKNKDTDSV